MRVAARMAAPRAWGRPAKSAAAARKLRWRSSSFSPMSQSLSDRLQRLRRPAGAAASAGGAAVAEPEPPAEDAPQGDSSAGAPLERLERELLGAPAAVHGEVPTLKARLERL